MFNSLLLSLSVFLWIVAALRIKMCHFSFCCISSHPRVSDSHVSGFLSKEQALFFLHLLPPLKTSYTVKLRKKLLDLPEVHLRYRKGFASDHCQPCSGSSINPIHSLCFPVSNSAVCGEWTKNKKNWVKKLFLFFHIVPLFHCFITKYYKKTEISETNNSSKHKLHVYHGCLL